MNQPLTKLEAIENRIDPDKVAGTALTSSGGGLVFQSVAEAMEVAKLMALSDLAVRKHLRGNPGACLGVLIQAVEWGMSPYAVANKSYSVNDQLAYESQLVQAVILRRAPIKGRIKFAYEGDGEDRVCIASATALDGDTVEYRSPKFGRITPKNSPLWKSDPDQQQAYYSGRALCRRHFPDVLLGIYDVDELEGSAGIRDVTPAPSGLAARLNAAPTGGFNAEGVKASLDAAVHADDAEGVKPEASVDPEFTRAGGQAFSDGEERKAPEDFTPEQSDWWLQGYDQAAKHASTPSTQETTHADR